MATTATMATMARRTPAPSSFPRRGAHPPSPLFQQLYMCENAPPYHPPDRYVTTVWPPYALAPSNVAPVAALLRAALVTRTKAKGNSQPLGKLVVPGGGCACKKIMKDALKTNSPMCTFCRHRRSSFLRFSAISSETLPPRGKIRQDAEQLINLFPHCKKRFLLNLSLSLSPLSGCKQGWRAVLFGNSLCLRAGYVNMT